MNFVKSTILVAATALTVTGLASAEGEKTVTVNVQKLFKDYYKTHDAQKDLNVFRERIQAENAQRVEKIQAIEKELTDFKKQLDDPSISEKKKAEITEAFRLKTADGMALDKERREYLERRNKSLQEQMGQKMRVIVEEINKIVEEKARQADYDFVFDASALSAAQTKVVMFSKDKFDITDSIMKDLNKDAPEGFDPSKAAEQEPTPAGN